MGEITSIHQLLWLYAMIESSLQGQSQFAPLYYTGILYSGHITIVHIFLGYYQTPRMLSTTASSSHLHKWGSSALAIWRWLFMFYKCIPMNKKAAIFCSLKWQVPLLESGRIGRILDISNAIVLSTRWKIHSHIVKIHCTDSPYTYRFVIFNMLAYTSLPSIWIC